MNGTPGIKGFVARPPEERFRERVDRRAPAECWTWLGSSNRDGYGLFTSPAGSKAHQFGYVLAHGPVPTGLTIDHLCRNRICVNPWHLEAVTRGENTRRAKAVLTTCAYGHPLDGVRQGRSRGDATKRYCKTCSRLRSYHKRIRNTLAVLRGERQALRQLYAPTEQASLPW